MSIVESLYSDASSTILGEEDLEGRTGLLYHYTTPTGLLGILRSQRIWATEASYLIDANEIEYGLALVRAELSAVLESLKEEEEKRIVSLALGRLVQRPLEVYVACFSEEADLLSQWKGFSNIGDGFAVGFAASELRRHKRKFPMFNISLQKVVYDRAEQSKVVRSQIARTLAECRRLASQHVGASAEIEGAGSHAMALVLTHKALFFKADAFREEREWRATFVNDASAEGGPWRVEFRESNHTIVPFLPLDLGPSAQKSTWTLPIAEIVIGARVNRERAEKSIRLLCNSSSMPVPVLRLSRIPLQ